MEEQEKIRRIVAEAVRETLDKKPEKPEHMTHLRGDHLVYKDHPRIAFRGAIDSLEAEIIILQTITEKQDLHTLTEDLEEIIKTIRWLLRCEVSGEPVGEITMQGLDTDAMRAHSHHPSQYYGMKHFLPTHAGGFMHQYPGQDLYGMVCETPESKGFLPHPEGCLGR